MENIIIEQLYSLLIYLLTGFIIGILFDIFRILRRTFKTPDVITYIEDILFWLLTGILLIYILITISNGQIRIYNVLGLIIGIITYLLVFSRIFINISIKILKIVIYPIKLLFNLIRRIFTPFTFFVINLKKLTFNLVKKLNKKQKITK